MVFASLEFLTLFLPAFLIIYALVPASWRNATLLSSSWIFYGWWSPIYLLLFIFLILVGWVGGMVIERAGHTSARGWALAGFIALNIGTLCWYKYANILVETTNTVLAHAGSMPMEWQRVALPIGLSFIVLQSISYLIDVYRRTVDVDRSFISFGAYQSMFVHLIAGPIIRYDWVKRELQSRPFDWATFSLGARRFMIGMSMKVLVGDTLAPIVDVAFATSNPSFLDAWIGCLAYSLQLFFDFAGYSAMAIALGQMLGFRFPENFNHPYLATSIQDFWRRWHLSLSSWIRDYLYIPLGGSRLGELRTYINLFLTMAIAGLWHGGDTWNFLLWGMAHGLALCIARAWGRTTFVQPAVWLSRIVTLLFVVLAWTIFRAHSFDQAMQMYGGQFGLNGFDLGDALHVALRPAHMLAFVLGVACIVAPTLRPTLERRVPMPIQTVLGLWPLFAFFLSFALIASRGAVPFLYFQF